MKHIAGIVLSLICIVYGSIILAVGSGTLFFLIWFLLAAFILLQTSLPDLQKKASGKGKQFLKYLKIFLNVIWITAGMVVIVTWLLIGTCFHDKGQPDADYLIVLGSQVRKDGPSVVTKYRLDAAYDYLLENPNTICIMSGGQGWNEPATEAVVMKQYLVNKGVNKNRILSEDQSRNTIENILNCKALIQKREGSSSESNINDEVCIVTNNFHLYRGTHLAMHAGFRNISGIAAYTTPIYLPNNMLRESLGILKDFLFGNL